jgi:hypothetical protein
VEAFLIGKIRFREIAMILERAVDLMPVKPIATSSDLREAIGGAMSIGKQAMSDVIARR